MATISAEAIFIEILGRKPATFDAKEAYSKKRISDKGAAMWAQSHLGTEYYLPVKLGGVQLPIPLISIETAEKNWVIRKMIAREGTTKGLLGTGDYRIFIRGFCVGKNGEWPEEQLELLSDLEKRKEVLDVENALTSIFLPEPQQCVLASPIRIGETRRLPGVVEYQMELLSDIAFTLDVTKK